MFDMHNKLATYFWQHVHLSNAKRSELAGYRDLNLERLKEGLDKIGEEDNKRYFYPIEDRDQGSYAMHTMIQSRTGEYDIDEGIIFDASDLPLRSVKARQFIARAFNSLNISFKKPPEVRTNAVTIWYANGYHVDFAIYRQMIDEEETVITEHAGPLWRERDPQEITDWFCDAVNSLSPNKESGGTVEAGQLRRIVCLLKSFAKSRDDWNMPGGFVITRLAVECYRADNNRDDLALYNTMLAIYYRLLSSVKVYDPIHSDQELTDRDKYVKQVENFRDNLALALDNLKILFDNNCDQEKAASAWDWIFQHDFWKNLANPTTKSAPYYLGKSRDARESPSFA